MDAVRTWCSLLLWTLLLFLPLTAVNARAGQPGIPDAVAALMNKASDSGLLSGHGAVILEKEVDLTPEADGQCRFTIRVTGLLLDPAAASDYGQISVPFDGHSDTLTLDYAKTYARGRAPLVVADDAIQNKTATPYGVKSYSDIQALTFSLPGLAPQVVFAYQISYRTRPAIAGAWDRRFNFHEIQHAAGGRNLPRIDPVLSSRVILHLPGQSAFVHKVFNAQIPPVVQKRDGLTHYAWTMGQMAGVPIEANMPTLGHLLPHIHLSSIPEWPAVGQWAAAQFEPNCIPDSTVAALARRITRGLGDTEARIRAVYEHVQSKIEYIQADFGRSGYRPHPAAEVLQNGYGDCKDQATLVIAMLRAIGIKARPALLVTAPYRDMDPAVPSLRFSHVIVNIPSAGGAIWLDPTAGSRFPALYWSDRGRNAFVLDGEKSFFSTTPPADPTGNIGRMRAAYHFEGDDLVLDLNFSADGALGERFSEIYGQLPPEQKRQALLAWIRGVYTECEVLAAEPADTTERGAAWAVTAKLRFKDLLGDETRQFPYGFRVDTATNYFTGLALLAPPQGRQLDYVRDFPCEIHAQWRFAPPTESFAVSHLPNSEKIDTRFLAYTLNAVRTDRAVRVDAVLSLKTAFVPRGDYADFYDAVQQALKAGQGSVVFRQQKADPETLALEKRLDSDPGDAQVRLALAGQYLKAGKYTDALTLLETIENPERQGGAYHYCLGLALGYAGRFDDARKAFDKARALGYVP